MEYPARLPTNCDLIGLVGNAAVGKDFVAAEIEKRGYIRISASDILREIIESRGFTPSRELQTTIANEYRREHGEDIFVRQALDRALTEFSVSDCMGIILSGIYAPSEGLAIQQLGGRVFEIVQSEVDDPASRFSRLQQRTDGPRDAIDYATFMEAFYRENSGKSDGEANIGQLSQLADGRIVNDGDARQLKLQLDSICNKIFKNIIDI